jgi:hypothetical protein
VIQDWLVGWLGITFIDLQGVVVVVEKLMRIPIAPGTEASRM